MKTVSRAAAALVGVLWAASLARAAGPVHVIHVVDEDTGRGVPLVELKTTHKVRYFTDSNGIVAFDEPGLLNAKVYFHVSSHGYEFPKDGFGYRGATVDTKAGGKTTLKIKRLNIAERLYRLTGAGVYADTVKATPAVAGVKVPVRDPLTNGNVFGQDTVQTVIFKGKLYWFWGDTDRPWYPLGQFSTSGATSEIPGKGGLDPSVGVNLKYWVDSEGFSKKMVRGVKEGGPVWISGLMILKDDEGKDRLLADYVVVKSLGTELERGLVVWDEAKEEFGPLSTYPLGEPLHADGPTVRVVRPDGEYFYFPHPYPLVRVKPEWHAVQDPKQYEAFTCLKPGSRYKRGAAELDRDASGKLLWAWKKNTGPVEEGEQEELIKSGQMKPEEGWFKLKDDKGARVRMHMASVNWNDYRKKWVMIGHETGGKPSHLGECWYAESDQPHGPFERAVKIVTHDKYTFYNVVQHPQFDQQGGKVVYFEGTYTNSFSGNDDMTPRYDYNQIMYRLDLSDPRLKFAQQ